MAIIGEVIATVSLKLSEGFSKPIPSAVVVGLVLVIAGVVPIELGSGAGG